MLDGDPDDDTAVVTFLEFLAEPEPGLGGVTVVFVEADPGFGFLEADPGFDTCHLESMEAASKSPRVVSVDRFVRMALSF